MSRLTGNWISGYVEYTREAEAPDSFHVWSGLSVLASAVRRNVWLNQGIYTVYPNLYVLLVGPSGKVGKSLTINLAQRLLAQIDGINFSADSLTREELIRELSKVGMVSGESALTIHSKELSSLIDPSGMKMIQFLTDIFDGDAKWRYATKQAGKDSIKNASVNILAGTTPSWFAEEMPVNVTQHGFTSRVIIVYEDEIREPNPRPNEPGAAIVESLVGDLNQIASLKGEMFMTPEADALYDQIYRSVFETQPSDYRIEGYHWRKARVHLLKVSMLLALSERDDLIITETDVNTAWQLIEALEVNMPKAFSAVGKFGFAEDMERIKRMIFANGGVSRAKLIEKNSTVGDLDQIDKLINMLLHMKQIEKGHKEGDIWYHPIRS